MDSQIKEVLRKQGHRFIGKHGSVKTCRWTCKSLVDEGVCYKEKFYGIESHRCCQMSPFLGCQNKCVHCWRPIEVNFNEGFESGVVDDPKEIIDNCIREQRKLLMGFNGNDKVNKKKYEESLEPMQFAISLIGEALLYPRIGELISELRNRGKTSFVVSNGLSPGVLRELSENGQLPTQLYISLNTPNKEMFDGWHNSSVEDSWSVFNECLDVMKRLDCRRVIRMTLVKGENMSDEMVKDYAGLIEKGNPDFVEVKGFMSVGFSRNRLGYEKMPSFEEVRDYALEIARELGSEWKILDEHEFSRVVLIGRDEKRMKIERG